ncbi:hypothetical protein CKAH01_17305 [Colletotrichum kahawae]|uniref:Uncharacterized protein n=1 Tax=Colletotrichum kahawae TaxID=34407 RepID=A0AAD9YD37_COLKA|nr:hypothetical protein CKAH01_17305 [Colletotrichum kahawae]
MASFPAQLASVALGGECTLSMSPEAAPSATPYLHACLSSTASSTGCGHPYDQHASQLPTREMEPHADVTMSPQCITWVKDHIDAHTTTAGCGLLCLEVVALGFQDTGRDWPPAKAGTDITGAIP